MSERVMASKTGKMVVTDAVEVAVGRALMVLDKEYREGRITERQWEILCDALSSGLDRN